MTAQSCSEIKALARSIRLKGFEQISVVEEPSRTESAIARALRAADIAVAEPARPIATVVPQPPIVKREVPRWLKSSTQNSQTVAIGGMSSQHYLRIDIAAAGQSDLIALESRMETPLAANYRGQATWLQRDCGDGRTTRAVFGMASDLARLRPVLGKLGSTSLTFSIGPIELAAFSPQGAVAPGRSQPAMLPSTCDALLRVTRS